MLAIYILLQQTLICLFCSLFCSCSLWFCLFVSAACSSACWWQRGYRLMMVVALICLAEKYRANRMQHCRPEIGSSVDIPAPWKDQVLGRTAHPWISLHLYPESR